MIDHPDWIKQYSHIATNVDDLNNHPLMQQLEIKEYIEKHKEEPNTSAMAFLESMNPSQTHDLNNLDYINDVKHMYDIVKDKSVLEIACGNVRFVEGIYNAYGIKSYTGVEPFEQWCNGGKIQLEYHANFKFDMIHSRYEDYEVTEVPDVVVCCGLLYHLSSPFHLLEWLANTNAEYIILETTGTVEHTTGKGTTQNTMERVNAQISEAGGLKEHINHYLNTQFPSRLNYEETDTPGNTVHNTYRSVPWRINVWPDIIVLAFSEMGYDLEASHERYDSLEYSKCNTTTYRFKRNDTKK